MTNYDLEELELLEKQFALSLGVIATVIVSLFLTYNEINLIKTKKRIFSIKDEKNILIMNRTVSILLSIGFLLINVYDKKTKEKYQKEDNASNLQITASIFSLIAAIIVLFVAFGNTGEVELENPEI